MEKTEEQHSGRSQTSMKIFAASLRSMLSVGAEHDYREYLSTISKDPALTARVLAVANSAFYYSVEPVYSLKDAADRLGLVKLKSIVLGHILTNKINTTKCSLFDKKRYWKTAMLVAVCASHVADYRKNKTHDGNILYCVGLLHNIGVLAFATEFPAEYNSILKDNDTRTLTI